ERAREVVPAVEVRADGRGVEPRAVLELHLVTEIEDVALAVTGDRPARRERGTDAGRPGLDPDEPFKDLLGHAEGLSVRNQRRIQVRRIRRAGKDERPIRGRVTRSGSNRAAQ